MEKRYAKLVQPARRRYTLLYSVIFTYCILAFITRLTLAILAYTHITGGAVAILLSFAKGFLFDITVAFAIALPYALYLLFFPGRWVGSRLDRILTYIWLVLTLLVIYFELMAAFPFWDEFGARFNFIAVDYLVYTYEVVSNINQSYPLPLVIGFLIALIVATFFVFARLGVFSKTFSAKMVFTRRLFLSLRIMLCSAALLYFVNNKMADGGNNYTLNEVSKNGMFSFFAAYRANDLDYQTFYPTINMRQAYNIARKGLLQTNQRFTNNRWDNISRATTPGTVQEQHPNIILIAIESFSGDFIQAFGNTDHLTPVFDSLARQSVFFTNLYATGTRTVRGMEALTLCVPPTPGNSIVRRLNNAHLFSIATILKQRNYQPWFIYGGDGYFDNMNNFFGGQGFNIVDRDRGNPLSESLGAKRFNIDDKEVTFENAWGVCDEDLYRQSLKYANQAYRSGKPFFQFVMTTSNHKPFTFPKGKIPQSQGQRNSAVRYTDFALGKFLQEARTQPWFKNTVFVIVADHCASSAGKWEINIEKHHIPAIIYNLPVQGTTISTLASQIDLMPTLFGYLNWNYSSAFYGRDINRLNGLTPRAFIGNYRTLGMLQQTTFTQIDDRKHIKQFHVSAQRQLSGEIKRPEQQSAVETIANYQTASERFKNGKMH